MKSRVLLGLALGLFAILPGGMIDRPEPREGQQVHLEVHGRRQNAGLRRRVHAGGQRPDSQAERAAHAGRPTHTTRGESDGLQARRR